MTKRVLILCTGNSCRSQMAEALWNHLGEGAWQAVSAGSKPAGYVHPLGVEAMGELGIDLATHRSKHLNEFNHQSFDLVVTVCDNAKESCPVFPGAKQLRHWPFPDPADATGSEEERLVVFRDVRDQIWHRISTFLHIQATAQIQERSVDRPTVLFLCTGNSARSQMAEAFLRKYAGDRFVAYSAGLDPKGINPLTIQVMNEIGISLGGHRSKSLGEFLGKVPVRYAIVVCEQAEKRCPIAWPFGATVLFWPFDDPATFDGSDDDRLQKFRIIRDQIEERILEWLSEVAA